MSNTAPLWWAMIKGFMDSGKDYSIWSNKVEKQESALTTDKEIVALYESKGNKQTIP